MKTFGQPSSLNGPIPSCPSESPGTLVRNSFESSVYSISLGQGPGICLRSVQSWFTFGNLNHMRAYSTFQWSHMCMISCFSGGLQNQPLKYPLMPLFCSKPFHGSHSPQDPGLPSSNCPAWSNLCTTNAYFSSKPLYSYCLILEHSSQPQSSSG